VTGLPLAAGAEFDRIRAIAAALGPDAATLGDDCAVIDGGGSIVLSTDTSVEGVHFRRDWLSFEEIGWRSAAAALSDLAAAGAECVGLLAAITAPRTSDPDELVALMRGVGDAVHASGGRVLGGDLVAGPVWTAAITVVGRAARPLSRRGARAGDTLWVTGRLGAARAALAVWMTGATPPDGLRHAFAHPAPRLPAGRWLAAHGATAMLDLSDGLAADAAHLAAASAVRIELDLATVPVAPEVSARPGEAAAIVAARGGEDYELLAAMPAGFGADDAAAFAQAFDLPLTAIGRVTQGHGVSLLLDGAEVAAPGYDHFA
jgi:thiamine-monophosphate kinase